MGVIHTGMVKKRTDHKEKIKFLKPRSREWTTVIQHMSYKGCLFWVVWCLKDPGLGSKGGLGGVCAGTFTPSINITVSGSYIYKPDA